MLLLVASLRETLHFGAREPLLVPLGPPGMGDWDPGCPPEVTWFRETFSSHSSGLSYNREGIHVPFLPLSVSLSVFLSVSVSLFISASLLPELCALEAVIGNSAQGHLSLRKAGPSQLSRASSGHNFSLGLGQRSLLLGISYYC